MAPLRAHFTLLHNSKIVGNFAHQFKGAVFTPVLKGVDTQVVHTHSLIVGAVADHIPLKQGLRLTWIANDLCISKVADHIPLKQGLRLISIPNRNDFFILSRRPYSIKTRIKTLSNNQ